MEMSGCETRNMRIGRRTSSRNEFAVKQESKNVFPVESNAIFLRMDDQLVRGLHARGWRFYKFLEPDVYRLMCSWATTDEEISMFIDDLAAIK